MPREKLSTSISKPEGIFPSTALSNSFRMKAASGPMIMAPRNIGVPPVNSGTFGSPPMMTPALAMAPMTAPR
jgi:hypothetical protein